MGPGIHSWKKRSRCCCRRSAPDRVRKPALFLVAGVVVGILMRRDVVDVEIVVLGVERPPILVGVVEARDRTLLDRSARLVALLLRFALVLRRRVGAEVAVARRGLRRAAGSRAAEAAGTRAAEAPRSAGTRAAEAAGPAGPGTAEAAAGTWSARAALLARARFADRQAAALEQLLIELSNRLFGDGAVGVVDEREAARAAGFTIDGQHDRRGFADAREMLSQLCLGRGIRQVADEQTDWHIGPRQNNTVCPCRG